VLFQLSACPPPPPAPGRAHRTRHWSVNPVKLPRPAGGGGRKGGLDEAAAGRALGALAVLWGRMADGFGRAGAPAPAADAAGVAPAGGEAAGVQAAAEAEAAEGGVLPGDKLAAYAECVAMLAPRLGRRDARSCLAAALQSLARLMPGQAGVELQPEVTEGSAGVAGDGGGWDEPLRGSFRVAAYLFGRINAWSSASISEPDYDARLAGGAGLTASIAPTTHPAAHPWYPTPTTPATRFCAPSASCCAVHVHLLPSTPRLPPLFPLPPPPPKQPTPLAPSPPPLPC
jgi:hypothetical protein